MGPRYVPGRADADCDGIFTVVPKAAAVASSAPPGLHSSDSASHAYRSQNLGGLHWGGAPILLDAWVNAARYS